MNEDFEERISVYLARLKIHIEQLLSQEPIPPDRVDNYVTRAHAAFRHIFSIAAAYQKEMNRTFANRLCVGIDLDALFFAVLGYNRDLVAHKKSHGIDLNGRVETYIAAGFWFCNLCNHPIFKTMAESPNPPSGATEQEAEKFLYFLGVFAWYVGFRILRGHYKKFQELELVRKVKDIRAYMIHHAEALSQCPAGSVGIFYAIAVLDSRC